MRARFARFLATPSFARSVGILSSGTVAGQVVMAGTLPLLTRLYSPEAFSALAAYSAALAVIVVIAPLRYDLAIPLPESDAEGMHLVALAALASAGISCLVALILFFVPDISQGLFGAELAGRMAWLLPIGIFIASTYSVVQYWSTRRRRFAAVARTHATRAVAGSGAQIGLGLMSSSGFGLALGHAIYGGVGITGLMRSILRHDRYVLRQFRPSLATAKKYVRFPLYSVPEALLNSAGSQLPVLLIASMGMAGEAGFLLVASRLMSAPMALIGSSVSQVFISEAPEHFRAGRLSSITRQTTRKLLMLGGPAIALAGALAPLALPLLLGSQWSRAGMIVLMMTPWYILQFATSPVSSVLHVTGRLRLAFALQLSGAVLRVGGVLVCGVLDAALMVETFAITSAVFYAAVIVVVLRAIRDDVSDVGGRATS